MACLYPNWELELSGHFFMHISGSWAGMIVKLISAGIVNWSVYMWPLHVVWASCSTAVGFREGDSEKACSKTAMLTWCWKLLGLTSTVLYWLKNSQVQVQWEGNIDSASRREDCQKICGHFLKATTQCMSWRCQPTVWQLALLESECTMAACWNRSWNRSPPLCIRY